MLPDLSVPGRPEVFALGEMVSLVDAEGVLVPGVAHGARQMGAHAAKLVLRELDGEGFAPVGGTCGVCLLRQRLARDHRALVGGGGNPRREAERVHVLGGVARHSPAVLVGLSQQGVGARALGLFLFHLQARGAGDNGRRGRTAGELGLSRAGKIGQSGRPGMVRWWKLEPGLRACVLRPC